MKSWIPFYRKTIGTDSIRDIYYRNEKTDSFAIQVADSLFLRTDYIDSVYRAIIDTSLRDTNNYLYSDLGFYLMQVPN